MATGNPFMGKVRGKLGDTVLQVLKGQQVEKAYNPHPANPRSAGQMAQRVKLGAAVGFYKRNKRFFKFAFKKKKLESDYNAFIRENLNIAPYMTKEDIVSNNLCPAPYVMTRGDLPQVEVLDVTPQFDSETSSSEIRVRMNFIQVPENNGTIGDLREALNLNYGDMFTVYMVASRFTGAHDQSPVITPDGIISFAQVVFTAENENLSMFNASSWDNLQNFDGAGMDTDPADRMYGITVTFNSSVIREWLSTDHLACGACAVISRKVAGSGLQVSTSQMVLSEYASEIYAKYRDEAALQKAMDSYGRTDSAFLEPQEPILRG